MKSNNVIFLISASLLLIACSSEPGFKNSEELGVLKETISLQETNLKNFDYLKKYKISLSDLPSTKFGGSSNECKIAGNLDLVSNYVDLDNEDFKTTLKEFDLPDSFNKIGENFIYEEFKKAPNNGTLSAQHTAAYTILSFPEEEQAEKIFSLISESILNCPGKELNRSSDELGVEYLKQIFDHSFDSDKNEISVNTIEKVQLPPLLNFIAGQNENDIFIQTESELIIIKKGNNLIFLEESFTKTYDFELDKSKSSSVLTSLKNKVLESI